MYSPLPTFGLPRPGRCLPEARYSDVRALISPASSVKGKARCNRSVLSRQGEKSGQDSIPLEAGHITEHWEQLDAIALLQQMGLAPQLQIGHP